MYQVCLCGNSFYHDKPHNEKMLNKTELIEYIKKMMHFHRTFEIFYNGKLIACGDETGVWTIGKNRQKIF